jgi:16S rRNA (cytosine967-C5)-methyltransferase
MMSERGPGAGAATLTRGGVTEARVAAADILADLRAGELLDSTFDRRVEPLEARDRRWTHELVYGTLRRRNRLDALLTPRVRGGLVRLDADLVDILRLGVYQLLNMGSVPPYAAIAQSVELAKRRHGLGASKLANAVLRRVDRERGNEVPAPADPADLAAVLALEHSHPRWLVARWLNRWPAAETELLLERNNEEAPIVVRPFGVVREQLEASLEGSGVRVSDVPLVGDSIRLSGAASLTDLGAYRQGLFFVQDPGATLVARYAAFPPGAVIADLCAAPGGKSLELARDAAFVVAGDRAPTRLARLRANLTRLDARNIGLVAADARAPAIAPVDGVLLDVPCTGTGTFRRHPDARWRLRVSDLAVMSSTQREILEAGASVVRPGGLLVYSTCSLEPEENDETVDAFLAAHPEWIAEPPPVGAVPGEVLDHGRLRVLPQRHGVDGAFAVRLRRAGA